MKLFQVTLFFSKQPCALSKGMTVTHAVSKGMTIKSVVFKLPAGTVGFHRLDYCVPTVQVTVAFFPIPRKFGR